MLKKYVNFKPSGIHFTELLSNKNIRNNIESTLLYLECILQINVKNMNLIFKYLIFFTDKLDSNVKNMNLIFKYLKIFTNNFILKF